MMDRLRARRSVLVASLSRRPCNAPAEPPRVQFDMPFAVACRDVTPPEFAAANPGHKLVEAELAISSLLAGGRRRKT